MSREEALLEAGPVQAPTDRHDNGRYGLRHAPDGAEAGGGR